jgi:Fe-S oxidoreductase
MESQGNPFGTQIARGDWVRSLEVPVLEEGGECDVVYWVGCLTTFDEEKQRIAVDLISILRQCEVDFALLGKGESCCGDPARVCGDENLFQTVAKSQVAALKKRTFRRILVSCPHCYNVLKNEYPQFGGAFDVVHHSQFLRDLIQAGRLRPGGPVDVPTVYHDPCYLGRYQKIFDAPRQVLHATSGSQFVDLEKCREESFCCGGGGGHFWMDTKEGERINAMRIKQVKQAGAKQVVTSCPYCLHMLRDATKAMNLEKEIDVVDLVRRVRDQSSTDATP